MLTWQNNTGYVFDLKLNKTDEFSYKGEGWGITTDGKSLIMSDGTSTLKYWNPENYNLVKTLSVTENGLPRSYINELEFVGGYIFANVWQFDEIVKINPENGYIVGKLDLSELRQKLPNQYGVDVLNGIAYNKESDSFYVTGKNWQLMFEIKISE
jgi:glutamine cyclotransferase